MSWQELTWRLSEQWAWPLTSLAVLILFRRTIRELLHSTNELALEAFGGKLGWKRTARRALENAALSARKRPSAGHRSTDQEPVLDVEGLDIIEQQYQDVRQALVDRLTSGNREINGEWDAPRLAHEAAEANLIEQASVGAVEGLHVMRDLAMTRPDQTDQTRTAEYTAIAQAAMYGIRNARTP